MRMSKQRPFDTLNSSLGNGVILKLKDGQQIRGKLKTFDVHMNIVLEEAEEVTESSTKRFGTIVVRGDNIIFVSPGNKES